MSSLIPRTLPSRKNIILVFRIVQCLPRSYSRGGYTQLRRWHWRDSGKAGQGVWTKVMMELNETSRHALGSLFALAVHGSHVQAGADGGHPDDAPWGEHSQNIVISTEEDGDDYESTMAGRWDSFWGYDIVKPDGLLDRVSGKLCIDQTAWQTLKALPLVVKEAGYPDVIQQYRGVVDPELAGSKSPYYHPEPLLSLPEEGKAATDEGLTQTLDAEDEDLKGDIKRAHGRHPVNSPARLATETAHRDKHASITSSTDEGKSTDPSASQGSKELGAKELSAISAGTGMDDTRSASELAARGRGVGPTAAAFTAATQLVEACVANLAMPQLDDIIQTDKDGKAVSKAQQKMPKPGDTLPPNVRWYDARARQALRLVAEWLHVPWDKLLLYECLIAQQAQAPEKKGEGKKQLTAAEKRMRALKIGAAAAGGGALLAITGGLAAPALAAVAGTALTTVGGAAAATTITGIMGSTVGAAALIAGFGAGGARFVGGKMARRIGDVEEFGFKDVPTDEQHQSSFSEKLPSTGDDSKSAETNRSDPPPSSSSKPQQSSASHGDQKKTGDSGKESSWFGGTSGSSSSWLPWGSKPSTPQQSVPLLPIPVSSSPRADPKLTKLIAVAGIVAEPDDFVNFWKGLGDKEAERFTLVWETKELIALKNSMVNMILSQAYTRAGQYLIENFVIQGLVAAVALPMGVISVSNLIDSNWAVVMNRAARAGELLAHLLMSGAHGDVPVTLVGNSMGARLVFYCLLELCRCKCKGIVENAYMLGAPVDVLPERWMMARSVVAGRCVNGYSKKDWVLALSFRAQQGTFRPAAGLGRIPVCGIENVDLTEIVNGHGDYVKNIDSILAKLGLAYAP